MAEFLSDSDIGALLQEPKVLPDNFLLAVQPRQKTGHTEAEVMLQGGGGNLFQVRVRQSISNPFDFSVILLVLVETRSGWFRLRRYNGNSHEHTNRIERGARLRGFHIHQATARYQLLGANEDGFAEPTSRYADVHSALQCLVSDCNCVGGSGMMDLLPFGTS
jgi:hypothetical protein